MESSSIYEGTRDSTVSGDQVPLCRNHGRAISLATVAQKNQMEDPGELPRISIAFGYLLNPVGASFICIHRSRFLCLLFFRLLIFLFDGWSAAGRRFLFFMENKRPLVASPGYRSDQRCGPAR